VGAKRNFLFQFAVHATKLFSRALNLAADVFFLSPFCCFPCAISAPDSNLDLNALELTLHQFKRLADPFFSPAQNKPSSFFFSFAFAFGCKRKDINAESRGSLAQSRVQLTHLSRPIAVKKRLRCLTRYCPFASPLEGAPRHL
jgi:hypothetical protein